MKTRKTVRLSTLRLSRNHPAHAKLAQALRAAEEACIELSRLPQTHGKGCGCELCMVRQDASGMAYTIAGFASVAEGLLLPEVAEVPGLALVHRGRPVA